VTDHEASHEASHLAALAEAYRRRVVAIAEALIESQDIERIFREAAPCYTEGEASGRDYCQILVLECLRLAELTDETWEDGGGVWHRLGLPTTRTPRPADVVYIPRAKAGNWLHHMAVFKSGDAKRHTSIDGNTSQGIAERTRNAADYDPRPIYYDVQPLIVAALERDRAKEEAAV
jgi:hypothetical protein